MKSPIGFRLLGDFCRTKGVDVAVKVMFLEEWCMFKRCLSLASKRDVGGNLLNTYLDDSAFAPPVKDNHVHDLSLDFGGSCDGAPDNLIMASAQNPLRLDLLGGIINDVKSELASAKKKGALSIDIYNPIAKIVGLWLKVRPAASTNEL